MKPIYLPDSRFRVRCGLLLAFLCFVLFQPGQMVAQASNELSSVRHPIGTNIVDTDGTVYFIGDGDFRLPYPSEVVFQSYGFNSWNTVLPANAEDLLIPLLQDVNQSEGPPEASVILTNVNIPPSNGSLVIDGGTIYLIGEGERRGFTSLGVFRRMGYSLSNVVGANTSGMSTLSPIAASDQSHPAGTIINVRGTLYYMLPNFRQGIPNMSVFDSWGFRVKNVVLANSYDEAVPIEPNKSNLGFRNLTLGLLNP